MNNVKTPILLLLVFWANIFAFGAEIKGQVWADQDNDHIQGDTELGVEGVRVLLLDNNNAQVATDTTDATGVYSFSNITVGSYTVQFVLWSAPIGLQQVAQQFQGFSFSKDCDADASGKTNVLNIQDANSVFTDIDLGLQVSPTALVSGHAWNDLNSNNINDAGDTPLENIIVSLVDSFGNTIHIDTTDNSGLYSFSPAEYGKYIVTFSPASFPTNFNPVLQNNGADDNIDSDANNIGISDTIQLSGDINNIDIGLRYTIPIYTLSGKVWYDGDNNGLREATEIGITNVFVNLLDTANNILSTDTTDADGNYSFSGLTLPQYFIKFDTASYASSYTIVTKDAGDDAVDSDAYESGKTDTINLVSDITNVDLGLYAPPIYGAANGKVWIDNNQNNLYNAGEPGLENFPVFLIASNGDTTMTTATNSEGKYTFANIAPDKYVIAFKLQSIPAGYIIASQNIGNDDGIDSDVSNTGISDSIQIIAGQTANYVDMGLIPPTPVITITNDTITKETYTNQSVQICLDTMELPGVFDNAHVCSTPLNGEATDFAEACFTYYPNQNFSGQDSFCVVVCDDLYCDTTFVKIIIKENITIAPIAVNDTDTVLQGTPTQLLVVANDSLFGLGLTDISIIDYPVLGTVQADTFGFLNYVPEPNICDETVELTYKICTAGGCDTATATIYIACNNLEVVGGFSPNGDGINENLFIKGITDYPDNKLLVFNRWGNLVYEKERYNNDWDGYWDDNNTYLPTGTYFYIFDTGDGGKFTGSFEIVR